MKKDVVLNKKINVESFVSEKDEKVFTKNDKNNIIREEYVINKQDFKDYFNERKIITKGEYIKYLENKNISLKKFPTISRLSSK